MRHKLQRRWAPILSTSQHLKMADFLSLETCPVCLKFKDTPQEQIPQQALDHINRHREAPPTPAEEIEKARKQDALNEKQEKRQEQRQRIKQLNHRIRGHKYKRGKYLARVVNNPDDHYISEIGDQYVNYHTRIINRLKQEREQLRR